MRLLLSTVITLKVSYSLLAVSDLYNNRGEKVGPVVMYISDASIEYFSRQHLPFAVLTKCVLLVFFFFLPDFTSPPVPHEIISQIS